MVLTRAQRIARRNQQPAPAPRQTPRTEPSRREKHQARKKAKRDKRREPKPEKLWVLKLQPYTEMTEPERQALAETTSRRGENLRAMLAAATRRTHQGKEYVSRGEPIFIVSKDQGRDWTRYSDLKSVALGEMYQSQDEMYVHRVSATALKPYTKDYKKWSQRLIGASATNNSSRMTPVDLGYREIQAGNCVKSSIMAQLPARAKKVREMVDQEMPDGPCTVETALHWMSLCSDAYVLNTHGDVMAFRAHRTGSWAPSGLHCATCLKEFRSTAGMARHNCPGTRCRCLTCGATPRDLGKHESSCGNKPAVKRMGVVVLGNHVSPVTHTHRLKNLQRPDQDYVSTELMLPELRPKTEAADPVALRSPKPWLGSFDAHIRVSLKIRAGRAGLSFDWDFAIPSGTTLLVPDLNATVKDLAKEFMPFQVQGSGRLTRATYATKLGSVSLVPAWTSESEPRMLSDQDLSDYARARNRIDPWLRSELTKGQWSESVDTVFVGTHKRAQVWGDGQEHPALDVNKAYSHVLCQTLNVPVPSASDRFVDWDGDGIQDDVWYLVRANPVTPAERIYFGNTGLSTCLGRFLREFSNWTGIAKLETTAVVPMDVSDVVMGLYNDFDERVAKNAVNHAIGLAGKTTNSARDARVFLCPDQAHEFIRDSGTQARLVPMDGLYVVSREASSRLRSGWRWSTWVTHQEYAAYDMAARARAFGDSVVGIKTDCLFLTTVPSGISTGFDIGEFKPVTMDKAPGQGFNIASDDDILEYVQCDPGWHDVESLDDAKHVALMARFPGSGKSWTWLEYVRNMNPGKVLVVAAQHATIRDVREKLGDRAQYMTAAKYFQEKVFGMTVRRELDISEYDVIVFEEAGLFPVSMLRKLATELPGMQQRVWLTLDTNQLAPVADRFYNAQAVDRLLARTVQNRIWLDQNRTLPESQMPMVLELESAMLRDDLAEMKRQVRSWAEPVQYADVCAGKVPGLRVSHVRSLGSLVSNALGMTGDLVFRGDIPGFVKNAVYSQADVAELTPVQIAKNFEDKDSVTYYSSQGCRTDGNVLLMDLESKLMTPQALWMAVFRARDLTKVRVVDGAQDQVASVCGIVRRKLSAYKAQDRLAGRPVAEFTFDQAWDMLKACRFRCYLTGQALDMDRPESWCFDRIDCRLSHTARNCRPCLMTANLAKAAREHGKSLV